MAGVTVGVFFCSYYCFLLILWPIGLLLISFTASIFVHHAEGVKNVVGRMM